MTKEDIGYLCNFQIIYNKKENKYYNIGMIVWDKDGRMIPVCDNVDFFSKEAKHLILRDSDLLNDDWSFSIPYEE